MTFGFVLRVITLFAFLVLPLWSGAKPDENSDRLSTAIFWYAKHKGIESSQVAPQVKEFLSEFFEFLEHQDKQNEATTESLLQKYDAIIQNTGTSEAKRRAELAALSIAIQDPTTDKDDVLRLRFLERFHHVIDAHYVRLAEVNGGKKSARYGFDFNEGLKTVGTYTIYSICISASYHFLSGEYKTLPILSDPVMLRAGVIAVAAPFFAVLNQYFIHAHNATMAHIRRWREQHARRAQCEALFKS